MLINNISAFNPSFNGIYHFKNGSFKIDEQNIGIGGIPTEKYNINVNGETRTIEGNRHFTIGTELITDENDNLATECKIVIDCGENKNEAEKARECFVKNAFGTPEVGYEDDEHFFPNVNVAILEKVPFGRTCSQDKYMQLCSREIYETNSPDTLLEQGKTKVGKYITLVS